MSKLSPTATGIALAQAAMARSAITQALIAQALIVQAFTRALQLKLMLFTSAIAPSLLIKALIEALVPKL